MRTAADRWRLDRTLQQERNLLHSLMNNVPDAIFFKDRALNFTRVNVAQAALLGVDTASGAIGHSLTDLAPGGHADDVEQQERLLLDSGVPLVDKEESAVDATTGEAIWHSITKVPIRRGDEITGLVGIARDISKRKQAEDYLRRGHDELQQAVEERTSWLRQEIRRRTAAEEQARAALVSAEASSRAKTIFLANMSHELRTPLNAIIGFAELAATMMDQPELVKYGAFLGNIDESAHHLLRVINDILDVSRIEVGKVTLRDTEVDIGDVIQGSLRLVGPVAAGKGQTLAFSIADHFPKLKGDERLLKQTLLNIISNAAKFTPEGGHIAVKAWMEDGAIAIAVEDDGVGIAASDIPLVLLPFGQVENAMQRKHDGTGLGLPLAKGFMELHGGTLSLESVIDEGTRVVLVFPPDRTIAPPISA